MRMAKNPVQFDRTTRIDSVVARTSGRAGVVNLVDQFPLLRGDSCSGRAMVSVELAEMPKPLENAVVMNLQAWFVPKSAHPKFGSYADFVHSYQGEPIKQLGAADRTPPPFYTMLSSAQTLTAAGSDLFKGLGIHVPTGAVINTDLIDAFNIVYNFRLKAHSSKMERKKYATEDLNQALALPRAFWPSSRYSRVVPDYEQALVIGRLDLDVLAGQVNLVGKAPVVGITRLGSGTTNGAANFFTNTAVVGANNIAVGSSDNSDGVIFRGSAPYGNVLDIETDLSNVIAEIGGRSLAVSLADIDKARVTQAFAKLRSTYAGTDTTGFMNDDAIIAELMQGFRAPEDRWQTPWLLDSKLVPVNMLERHATDGASLDQSVTTGAGTGILSLNVPAQDFGGIVVITCEVLPEKMFERQTDETLLHSSVDSLPNALRDVQRPEPVDLVSNRRIDAKHATPNGLYGYEPMNDQWNREFTRLGGDFYQATPGSAWTEQRSAIWLADVVNPEYSDDHFLAPTPFPHDVFSDTTASAYEATVRHNVTIVGLTQIGDVLVEDSGDYDHVVGDE